MLPKIRHDLQTLRIQNLLKRSRKRSTKEHFCYDVVLKRRLPPPTNRHWSAAPLPVAAGVATAVGPLLAPPPVFYRIRCRRLKAKLSICPASSLWILAHFLHLTSFFPLRPVQGFDLTHFDDILE